MKIQIKHTPKLRKVAGGYMVITYMDQFGIEWALFRKLGECSVLEPDEMLKIDVLGIKYRHAYLDKNGFLTVNEEHVKIVK